jgi:hypothetical protein
VKSIDFFVTMNAAMRCRGRGGIHPQILNILRIAADWTCRMRVSF